MQAYVIHRWGGSNQLRLEEVAKPQPAATEIVIQTSAIGLNPLDYIIVSGTMKDTVSLPAVIGSEVAGVVTAVGTNVTSFQIGDPVMGLINFPGSDGTIAGHGYAQFVAVPADQVIKKPDELSFETAAALPATGLTAWQALHEVVSLPSGSNILIHGASGGVGHMAVQIATLGGGHVIATAQARHHSFVTSLGAEKVIDYKHQRFEMLVSNTDFVLDTVGGDTMSRSLLTLKRGGTLVTTQWPEVAAIQDEATARGVHATAVAVHTDRGHLGKLAQLVAKGSLRVNVDHVYSFAELPQALEHLKVGGVRGKLVVQVGGV